MDITGSVKFSTVERLDKKWRTAQGAYVFPSSFRGPFGHKKTDGVMPSASVRLTAKTLLLSFFFFLFLDADIEDARDDKFNDGKDCEEIVLFGHEA